MEKFWTFQALNQGAPDESSQLRLDGVIGDMDGWDDVTPKGLREALKNAKGRLTVYINSPGGDVVAASQIYTALKDRGRVDVVVDGMAASAASVVAMAGDTVWMAPTAYLMIHDPMTCVAGNAGDMKAAEKMLDEVKGGLVKAYALKSGLDEDKIWKLMEQETWLNAVSAKALGFCDKILYTEEDDEPDEDEPDEDEGERAEDKKKCKALLAPLRVAARKKPCLYAALAGKAVSRAEALPEDAQNTRKNQDAQTLDAAKARLALLSAAARVKLPVNDRGNGL